MSLSADSTDDLIYDARIGDLSALQTDLATLSTQLNLSTSQIIASAIDAEPQEEGGTGCCLLHFPAANGNIEILSFLLQSLDETARKSLLNHRNHSGNTPLHWAALNTHLECVKALVEAGADLAATNDAGLDAVFLAERADWSAEEEKEQKPGGESESAEVEVEVQAEAEAGESAPARPMTKAREVVEWLLSSEKAAELESGVDGSKGKGNNAGEGPAGEKMEE